MIVTPRESHCVKWVGIKKEVTVDSNAGFPGEAAVGSE